LDNNYIEIKGASLNNLKGIDINIPHNKIVVVTGVSGSGKSSLIFDTLYAEGQRRYVESLSSYARQFLSRMKKPEVEYINGLAPAIAIEQKVNNKNPRSTVGTSTEIYDYLKLLFARIGKTISPVSGKEVKRHSVKDVLNFVNNLETGDQIYVLTILEHENISPEHFEVQMMKGFVRILVDGNIHKIEGFDFSKITKKSTVYLVLDRLVFESHSEEQESRIADSVENAFWEGNGKITLYIKNQDQSSYVQFSNLFELDGISFEVPSQNLLSFNNPYGACKSCGGMGDVLGIDEKLVIPDTSLSLYDGVVMPWRSEAMSKWKDRFISFAEKAEFPIHRPYFELTEEEKNLLWQGNKYLEGINAFFKMVEENSYKIQYRVMLSRYRGKTICKECKGTKIRLDANYLKLVDSKSKIQTSISQILLMSIDQAFEFFSNLNIHANDEKVAKRILVEVTTRLSFLSDVGLGYLSLNRKSNSLSGGESQRINLATSLGSNLVGSMYILDEPSIGLHPRDTARLVKVLTKLKDAGNSVIIVEHEEDIMHAADEIIDIGPMAGSHGGELVYQGSYKDFMKKGNGLTSDYLRGEKKISFPSENFSPTSFVEITNAREHNLKNISIKFPLEALTVVTGVSGSGKSSLVHNIIYPAVAKELEQYGFTKIGEYKDIKFNRKAIGVVEMVNQDPIGKSSRSNPVTYSKAYDHIRELFASRQESKRRMYEPKHFSFNVDGGRCDNCKGEGQTTIEMQFMADIQLECEVCKGKRFKEDVLEIQYDNKNIAEVLDMTVDEALGFFKEITAISSKLQPLQDVGLGYVKLGQSSNTLSGGEAQRVKLASFLAKSNSRSYTPTLFIFDEPTTGLHFHDINKLVKSLKALIEKGNTVLVVEHNTEVIKCADWIIDLGPEGGEAGGNLVFQGITKEILDCKESYTAEYLRDKF
jgi:excinuclease ABC subunit A